MLPEALDNIRQPFTLLEEKIDSLTEKIDQIISWQREDSAAKQHGINPGKMAGEQSNDKEGVP